MPQEPGAHMHDDPKIEWDQYVTPETEWLWWAIPLTVGTVMMIRFVRDFWPRRWR
jgi:hypothetical protein